jgi:hypothetical protein
MFQVFAVIPCLRGNANHPDQERAYNVDGYNYGQDSKRVGSDDEATKPSTFRFPQFNNQAHYGYGQCLEATLRKANHQSD